MLFARSAFVLLNAPQFVRLVNGIIRLSDCLVGELLYEHTGLFRFTWMVSSFIGDEIVRPAVLLPSGRDPDLLVLSICDCLFDL